MTSPFSVIRTPETNEIRRMVIAKRHRNTGAT
jgi:hypothetical protein